MSKIRFPNSRLRIADITFEIIHFAATEFSRLKCGLGIHPAPLQRAVEQILRLNAELEVSGWDKGSIKSYWSQGVIVTIALFIE
jgi:hypothetical protein